MSAAKHLALLAQGMIVWAAFWLGGLPAYYQQYSPVTMAVGCILLGVAVSLGAIVILLREHPDSMLRRAVWISFYFTFPLAILDWLYCGILLGHGAHFPGRYWYATVFYFTPWLTLVPTALLLRRAIGKPRAPGAGLVDRTSGPMTSALLIIDVQQALCSGEYEAFESRRVIARINQVSRMVREVGAPIVIIQHETQNGALDFGTEGWKVAPGLEVLATDTYVRKKSTDSFHNTDLHAVLQARGITNLIICGLQSEFCIDTTTRRALALGYPVTLVADGHSTLDNGVLSAALISAHHNETLANITSFGPRVRAVPASEVRIAGGG